jgi:succinate dehydrogenase/fumarate reductase iron-sulfur protein
MTNSSWNIRVRIPRQRQQENSVKWQEFVVEIEPDETVLDAVEKIWAFHDRSLTFRHACHHSTCGACGMRVNGVEKLTCITPIREVTQNNGTLLVEPLRNFPVISDLVVDVSRFFQDIERMKSPPVTTNQRANLGYEPVDNDQGGMERLIDCIECGICVSACPVALTDGAYLGPASLAGMQQAIAAEIDEVDISLTDHHSGAWRCHSAFECSAVCPSHVEPGYRIMDLRKQLMRKSFKKWFTGKEKQA